EVEPLIGRNRLKQTLSVLRTNLEPAGTPSGCILLADRETVQLNTERTTIDVAEFEAAGRRAALASDASERAVFLANALETYRGPLLPGFFDDWILTERERLSRAYVEILLQYAAVFEQAGDLNQAVAHARRALDVDALCEEAHCVLIRLSILQGRPAEAVR